MAKTKRSLLTRIAMVGTVLCSGIGAIGLGTLYAYREHLEPEFLQACSAYTQRLETVAQSSHRALFGLANTQRERSQGRDIHGIVKRAVGVGLPDIISIPRLGISHRIRNYNSNGGIFNPDYSQITFSFGYSVDVFAPESTGVLNDFGFAALIARNCEGTIIGPLKREWSALNFQPDILAHPSCHGAYEKIRILDKNEQTGRKFIKLMHEDPDLSAENLVYRSVGGNYRAEVTINPSLSGIREIFDLTATEDAGSEGVFCQIRFDFPVRVNVNEVKLEAYRLR